MIPIFTSQNGYSSCIKIAGMAILPPLITEERRTELKEEKAKAIEIEKRIKRKRSSIDSGVMTGSYIDNLKNSETLLAENSACHELSISDLTINENIHQNDKPSCESVSSDNFLKTALEDSEFREFFYSAAERIFKDNNILNENRHSYNNSSLFSENHSSDQTILHNERSNNKGMIEEPQTISCHSHPTQRSNFLDLVNGNEVLTFSTVKKNGINKFQETTNITNLACIEVEEQTSSPPNRLRRNSYTLDSPSPVLLEHMAKGNAPNEQNSDHWQVLSEKKEKFKGLGFKAFLSSKKQRKTWNKKDIIHSPSKVDNFSNTKVPQRLSKKSKTFVKSEKHDNSNYSLPCSSRSSPTHLFSFAYSTDCIQSVLKKHPRCVDADFELNVSNIYKQSKEVKVLHQPEISHSYENKHIGTEKDSRSNIDGSSKYVTNTVSINNTSVSSRPNYEAFVLFPSQDMPSSSTSRNSCIDQLLGFQQKSDFNKVRRSLEDKKDPSNEMDDTVSACSSLSLSKYMPVDDNMSRPSTAEDLSAMVSELELKHELQIAELLEMQHKEKAVLTHLHSNCGSISSQSTANISVSEFSFDHNNFFPVSESGEKRTPCSRELFPRPENNKSPPKEVKLNVHQHYNSENEKIAAEMLTAYVRGYLTRRLLKTEKVQQLIDTIKESLNCAFSLQSETELRKNDLELHERLAHQLTAALYELQTIISAPVATRMATIAADREKLRKPVSRPSSAISSATQKSILRRQQSLITSEKKSQENNHKSQEIRPRTKSLCLLGTSGTGSSGKSDSSSTSSTNSRKPWR